MFLLGSVLVGQVVARGWGRRRTLVIAGEELDVAHSLEEGSFLRSRLEERAQDRLWRYFDETPAEIRARRWIDRASAVAAAVMLVALWQPMAAGHWWVWMPVGVVVAMAFGFVAARTEKRLVRWLEARRLR